MMPSSSASELHLARNWPKAGERADYRLRDKSPNSNQTSTSSPFSAYAYKGHSRLYARAVAPTARSSKFLIRPLRQTSPIVRPCSAWRETITICASEGLQCLHPEAPM